MELPNITGKQLMQVPIVPHFPTAGLQSRLEGWTSESRRVGTVSGPLTNWAREKLAELLGIDEMHREMTAGKTGVEHQFERNERQYRTLVESAGDVIWTVDLALRYTYVSPSVTKMLGHTVDEIMCMRPLDGFTPESREEVVKVYREEVAREADGPREMYPCRILDVECYHKDGSIRWAEIKAAFLRDEAGTPVGILGITRDISERKRVETELRTTCDELEKRVEQRTADVEELNKRLLREIEERTRVAHEREDLHAQLVQAQKMEALGTLAGGIAHDFNNLLQVVVGYCDMLLVEKEEDQPEYAELERILHAAQSGAKLVQRILTFSRTTEFKPELLDLNDQIEQVKHLLTRTIPKMIEIDLVMSGDPTPVNADPTQVEQVLMNLAVNAKDAMPHGGKLTFETRRVTLDEAFCTMHPEAEPGEYVRLCVSDTGHGMDQETLNRIFEPFFTTKEKGKGTGLGLAMVSAIVRQHGGCLTCSSEPEAGTSFNIYLPVVIRREVRSEPPGEKPKLPCGTETVLLVDDEEFIRDFGNRILSQAGYTVLTAATGRDALELYNRQGENISLVILDLIMPEMSGMECLEKLHELDPKAKILIGSGLTLEGEMESMIRSAARGFVAKPYDIRTILEVVRETLDAEESVP